MVGSTAESEQARGGPGWLVTSRERGRARLEEIAQPSEQDEDWRYGLIDQLDLGEFAPIDAVPGEGRVSTDADGLLEALGDIAAIVRTCDGRVVDIPHVQLVAGLTVSSFVQMTEAPSSFARQSLDVDEQFAAMADAKVVDGVHIEVGAGLELGGPVVVVHELSAQSERRIVFPRTSVHLGSRAWASVVELFVSGEEHSLVVPVTEVELDDQSSLSYLGIQSLGTAAWQLGYLLSRVGRDANISSFSAAFGGRYARLFTRSRLVEQGATSELSAVYVASGNQVHDFRTFQEHEAPRTKSELVFKGALDDDARSVYTGLIHMHKGARRSEASQTNRNVLLSPGAHADSVPNLDIEENDVRCSHASAVGPIDAEQRFYLESRGVPSQIAERLLLLGFFEDLLEKVPVRGGATYLSEIVTKRLANASALSGAAI